jgi:phosphoglycolate phosphatase
MTLEPQAFWRGRPLRALLFDLDGTLLDTASDIARALNRTLADYALEPLPVVEVSRMIGRGSPMLIERAAAARGRPADETEKSAMLKRFLHHSDMLHDEDESDALPYTAVADTLQWFHDGGMKIAVVTNKHYRFASGLLERLELSQWIDVLVGGDTCKHRKPDPEPLLFACQALAVAPSDVLMVGDSINDVRAARAAGIPVVCVPYGYNEGEDPRALPCDAIIETLAELPGLLRS